MAAHRYWRLVGFSVSGTGLLELSEARLFAGGVAVDSSATISATVAPASGALSYLKDGGAAAVVSWAAAQHRQPSFALVWDLGVGAEVTQLQLGSGSAANTFPQDVIVQSSDDSAAWTTELSFESIVYPGPAALTSSTGGSSYSEVVMADAPLAYWRMEEATGTVMNDSSGNGYHGAYGNLVTKGAPAVINSGSGIRVLTQGSGTVALVSDAPALRLTGDFTIGMWIRTAAVGGRLISKEQAGATWPSWALALGSGKVAAEMRTANGGGTAATVTSAATINDNEPHLVVCTKVGDLLSLYIDKRPVVTAPFPGTVWSSSSPIGVACVYAPGYGAEALIGDMDEVMLFSRGISKARVDAYYDAAMGQFLPTQRKPRWANRAPSRASVVGAPRLGGVVTARQHDRNFSDAYFSGRGYISGTVKEKHLPANTPLRREVFLLDENTNLVIRKTWSDAVTGEFHFRGIREAVPYTTLAYDHRLNHRATVANNLYPVLLP